ncbi:uncharacterized protein LOC108033840 [Drosophila biarmipes]|uniref:uncharacterized protein LOC108033840 n=1 Tax=Drosophila biarmipes TaxID=125945 RepID=UPI0007E754C3|nr:uncharacterized protein LOC108033840 [Drosophila biarmipes]
MEEDLEFLINALSVPNTPLTEPYDEVQLLEMRESFKTLQKLLRRSSLPVEASLRSMPRSKAGEHTNRFEERDLSSVLALVGNDYERVSDRNSGSQDWKSAESGARTSPIILECGLRDRNSSSSGSECPDVGDMALVPYEELCNERSSSETTVTGQSYSSSGISISIPVNLVWNNREYQESQSTDSETTLKADGRRYSVLN